MKVLYRKLPAGTVAVVGQAQRFAKDIAEGVKRSPDVMKQAALEGMKKELETMAPRVKPVIRQTRARVLHGDTHAEGKGVSLFEPATEVLRRGKAKQPTEFGKMIKVREAEGRIITSYEVYAKRPSDSDLLVPAIEVHQERLGRVPRLVAGDAGVLLGTRREGGPRDGSQAGLAAQSLHQESGAREATEETLVQERAEMENRMRRQEQRTPAPPWLEQMPLQRRRWYENPGRSRSHP